MGCPIGTRPNGARFKPTGLWWQAIRLLSRIGVGTLRLVCGTLTVHSGPDVAT